MSSSLRLLLITLSLLLAAPLGATDAIPWQKIRAVMHVHSAISPHGTIPIPAIAQMAQKKGIDVLIPTDHFVRRWAYGLVPLPGLLRRTVRRRDVLRHGVEKYLTLIRKVDALSPNLMVLPGLEVSPAYYWTGHLTQGNLTLQDAQRHLLVIGLKDPDVVRGLPVLSNPHVGTFQWRPLVAPLLMLLAGIVLMFRWPAGLFVVVLALGWGWNQRPFHRLPAAFEDYTRNGYDGAQTLIDYVQDHEGLAIWSHPEAKNWAEPKKLYRSVSMQTKPYPEAIVETRRHHGFAYIWEGRQVVGKPGGSWDSALLEYAQGQRHRPPWAFAELDWVANGRLDVQLDSAQNVLWVKKKEPKDVMEAFRTGRFYAYAEFEDHGVSLDLWEVVSGDQKTLSGGTVSWRPGAELRISLEAKGAATSPDGTEIHHNMEVTIVRNGRIWKELKAVDRFRKSYPLPQPEKAGQRDYYRLALKEHAYTYIASNPIFVQKP